MKLPFKTKLSFFLNSWVVISFILFFFGVSFLLLHGNKKADTESQEELIHTVAQISHIYEERLDNGGVLFTFRYTFVTEQGDTINGKKENPHSSYWHSHIGDQIFIAYNKANPQDNLITEKQNKAGKNVSILFSILFVIAALPILIVGIFKATSIIKTLKNAQPVWAKLTDKYAYAKINKQKKYCFTYEFKNTNGETKRVEIKAFRRKHSFPIKQLKEAQSAEELIENLPQSKHPSQKREIIIYNSKDESKALLLYTLSKQTQALLQNSHSDFPWSA